MIVFRLVCPFCDQVMAEQQSPRLPYAVSDRQMAGLAQDHALKARCGNSGAFRVEIALGEPEIPTVEEAEDVRESA